MLHQQSPFSILALDDEADALEQLSEILSRAGYVCRCAQNSRTAAALIHDAAPDLIIADVNLAGYNGMAICEQLKHDAALDHVPVMFLSSAQVPDIIRRSHTLGGTYHVRKPFDPAVLLELIAKALPVPHLSGA